MTEPKQISVMAAMKTAYAWKASVTSNAGISMNQKRMGALIVALFLSVIPAFGQGTIMPNVVFTGLDASGNPLVSGKLCTYVAGTSTPATTYTTSALTVANANPVILSAAGRATVFLRPGSSYKFSLYSAGSDQTCSTGTLQWTADNISALPTSNVNLDFDGTAGESLAAGDVVYLSDGTGARTQGSWYKADADTAAYSSEAPFIGMVPAAIASGSTGTIRIKGLVTVTGPLTASTAYYASGTAGALTSTAPTLVRQVGVGYTSTSILVSPANEGKLPALNSSYVLNAVAINRIVCGRLTLTTGTAVTTADVTAATTVYYTPYNCNQIAVYSSSQWKVLTFTEKSIALGADTTALPYDVFAYDNAGTLAIERLAWTNTTTRATALTTQDGVLVKTAATDRRYVGTYYTTGAGQTTDSVLVRGVWNYYNRVHRTLNRRESTATWNYTLAAWQQANASTANQVAYVVGVAEDAVELSVQSSATNGGSVNAQVAIGINALSPAAGQVASLSQPGAQMSAHARLTYIPAIGYSYAAWLEWSTATGTTTWASTVGGHTAVSGIIGVIRG